MHMLASEVLEQMDRAGMMESRGEDPEAGAGEWAVVRGADAYRSRCRKVRTLGRVENLSGDLEDGSVLAVMCAALSTPAGAAFNPATLWTLDEKDPEKRAAHLCECLRMLLPTQALRCSNKYKQQ